MGVKSLQVNMTHGEITPLMHARVDSDLYAAGLALARNWIVLRYGGVTRAPGTLHKGRLKTDDRKTMMLPFKFKRGQVYCIEAGHNYFRFWTRDGRVESPPGTPVEVATTYDEADLGKIQVRQLGDVVYIVCDGYKPKTLTRNSETDWVFADYAALYGPYMAVNSSDTTLTPAARGSVTPNMSDNTTPSGTASSGDASANAYLVFDGSGAPAYELTDTSGSLGYSFGGGVKKVADGYWLQAERAASQVSRTPTAWSFQGYTGADWVTLDTRSGESGWNGAERRYYEFVNSTDYEAYQIVWDSTDDTVTGYSSLAELAIHESADFQTPFNLVASAVAGINDGDGFQAGDVGRFIRLLGSDGRWRDAKITSINSATSVKIVLYGHALPDLTAISNWQLGAWGGVPGYPRAIGIKDDRIIFGATPADPLGVWATRPADYDNFGISTPLVLDDALNERLTGGELNEIQWFADGQDIIAGTAGSIRAIGLADTTKAFGPGNVRQLSQTQVTTSTTPGFEIENMLVFLDLYGRRLFEAAYSNVPDAYVARELSALNEHLFLIGVTRLAYQSVPHRIIWGVTSDGDLLAITYDRDQKVFGVTHREFDGVVDDVLTLPAGDADDLFVTIRRDIGEDVAGCMELLGPFYRSTVHDYPVYLDSAFVYTGAASNGVTGLDLLADTQVGVWADGKDFGDIAVNGDGELVLPNDMTAETIVVGPRIPAARVEGLRFGANVGDGASLGRRMRIANARIDLFETQGLKAGTLVETYDLVYEGQDELDPFDPPALLTGSFPYPAEDSFRNAGVFVFETNSAYPATVRGIMLDIEGEP